MPINIAPLSNPLSPPAPLGEIQDEKETWLGGFPSNIQGQFSELSGAANEQMAGYAGDLSQVGAGATVGGVTGEREQKDYTAHIPEESMIHTIKQSNLAKIQEKQAKKQKRKDFWQKSSLGKGLKVAGATGLAFATGGLSLGASAIMGGGYGVGAGAIDKITKR